MTDETKTKIFNDSVTRVLYSPQEASFYGVELIRAIEAGKSRSLIFPVAGMRNYVAPLMPWETMVIMAQTSNYKSGMFDFWEHTAAEQLIVQERANEAILHISLEETVEAMAFRGFARLGSENAGALARGKVSDWDRLLGNSAKFAGIPIYRIGDSTMNRAAVGIGLYLTNIERAVDSLVRGDVTGEPVVLGGIFLDYVQALPLDPEVKTGKIEMQRRLQIVQDVYRLQKWPVRYNCPVVYAAQCKQQLQNESGNWKLPGMYDGEESAVLAQRPDRIITQWLPKQTCTLGTMIEYGSVRFRVEENMLLMRVAKQRGGLPAGKIYMTRVDYTSGTIITERKPGTTALPQTHDPDRDTVYGQD